jgi:hypothetical protein
MSFGKLYSMGKKADIKEHILYDLIYMGIHEQINPAT